MSVKEKKELVRYASAPVPSCQTKTTEKGTRTKKVHFSETDSEDFNEVDTLNTPKFLTILQLANEVNRIRNSQCCVCSKPQDSNYRNLNFAPDEKVFQNLIDLELPEKTLPGASKNLSEIRCALKKDPYLNCQKLSKCSIKPGYLFAAKAKPAAAKHKPAFDGYSLYNKMKIWKTI